MGSGSGIWNGVALVEDNFLASALKVEGRVKRGRSSGGSENGEAALLHGYEALSK